MSAPDPKHNISHCARHSHTKYARVLAILWEQSYLDFYPCQMKKCKLLNALLSNIFFTLIFLVSHTHNYKVIIFYIFNLYFGLTMGNVDDITDI